MDLITVIVPIYNVEEYLERCLKSIINQTYRNLEIILVDDGSPDNSGKICDEYAKRDNRIKVIHKENGGVSSARNIGLKNATGKYISFIDSDDWLELNAYEELIEQLKKNKVDMVKCGFYKEINNQSIEKDFIYETNVKLELNLKRNEIIEKFMSGKIDAGLCYMLIKKECIDKIQKFNTSIPLGEDLLFELELICVAETIYMYNKRFYHYFNNQNSATYSPKLRRRNIESLLNLNIEVIEILKKYNNLTQDMINGFNFYCFYNIYIQLIKLVRETGNKETITFLLDNDLMKNIINSVKTRKLTFVNKLFVYLFINKYKKMLFAFCFVIGTLKGVKNINKE